MWGGSVGDGVLCGVLRPDAGPSAAAPPLLGWMGRDVAAAAAAAAPNPCRRR
eukprot:gene36258-5284_t